MRRKTVFLILSVAIIGLSLLACIDVTKTPEPGSETATPIVDEKWQWQQKVMGRQQEIQGANPSPTPAPTLTP